MVRLWEGALRDADYMMVASFATHPRVLSNPVFCRSMCSFCFLFLSVVGHPLLFPGGVCISFGTALIGLNITFLIPWDLLKPSFRNAPINVMPAGGGGGMQGIGRGFYFFKKLASKFPAHGKIIPVKCNQISLSQATHCCQSQRRTQERHNKNISK